MVSHFSANQYEDAFTSTKLRNWTIPRKYKERPSTLEGYTQIIANDRGHLLQGIPKSRENPWGTFMGTWDMPCKIPPARPSYTARSRHASKNLKQLKEESPLNNAVNGYKKFGKTTTVQISPVQRPEAPTPPRSNEEALEPSARAAVQSPQPAKTSRTPPACSPAPDKALSHRGSKSPSIASPIQRSPTPRSLKSQSPRPGSQLAIPDNRSIHSACTI